MTDCSRKLKGENICTIVFDLDNTLIPTRKGDKIACHKDWKCGSLKVINESSKLFGRLSCNLHLPCVDAAQGKVANLLVEKYGFSPEEASEATHSFLKNFRKCPENPDFPLHDWRHLLWKRSLAECHSEISGEVYYEWLNLRYKYIAPSPEVTELLESLRQVYHLVLITNGPSKSQWEKIKRLKLDQYFSLIFVSGDMKWEKPCEKIFLEACFCLGVPAERCIMVGDKLETDILGGIKAGFGGTVLVSLPESVGGVTVPGVVPDCIIDNVTHLNFFLSSKIKSGSDHVSYPYVRANNLSTHYCSENSSDCS